MMSKQDNHIDETLANILHSLAWSGKYTDAGQEVVCELEIERAKNRLDQYYADFYRNKILEARIDENAKMSQRYFNHSKSAFNADGDEFQAVACGQITHEHNKRKNKLTAQFNSKEE